MKKLTRLFISGFLTILPLGLFFYVIKIVYRIIDNMTKGFVAAVLGKPIPGVGFILTISLIFLFGCITNFVLGERLFNAFENFILKLPFAGSVYRAIKDISETITKNKKGSFSKVVMVEFPMKGVTSIGFITNNNVHMCGEDQVAVFIPTTPNPTNGFLVYVHKDHVKELDITVDQAIKTVVSMGSVDF
ncbi:DUF502 domain-containing protein [Wukongibacter baidiensis]|uniref:DUF502 domain-containing protein n=1 Tax=Wukongibacter baidiensis TaxID=1723361 RepID=UPI003D7F2561